MIRINLYQGGTKKARRVPSPPITISETATGVFLLLSIVAVIVATAGFNWWYYSTLQRKKDQLRTEKVQLEQDYRRLSQVKQTYQEREKQKDLYKKRVDVIDKLRNDQAGPVELLGMLGESVNKADDVWLMSMGEEGDGSTLVLKGSALSVHAVAELLKTVQGTTSAQGTKFFKQVDLRSAEQDAAVKDIQVFKFEIACVKLTAEPAKGAAQTKPEQPKK